MCSLSLILSSYEFDYVVSWFPLLKPAYKEKFNNLTTICMYTFFRNMNDKCYMMDFFDNHDMWHFTSATALFLAFIGLLTVDDDILFVQRNEIPVF